MSDNLEKEDPSEDNLFESKNIQGSTAQKTKYAQESELKK